MMQANIQVKLLLKQLLQSLLTSMIHKDKQLKMLERLQAQKFLELLMSQLLRLQRTVQIKRVMKEFQFLIQVEELSMYLFQKLEMEFSRFYLLPEILTQVEMILIDALQITQLVHLNQMRELISDRINKLYKDLLKRQRKQKLSFQMLLKVK